MAPSSSHAPGKSHTNFQSRSRNKTRPKNSRNKDGEGPRNGRSLDDLKKEIQHATQLLDESPSLPANKRVELERAVAARRYDLAVLEYERRKQKMIKKYHKIRFFERQKATRQLKRLRKQLAAIQSQADSVDRAGEVALLQRQIHEAEVDLNYALYFPLDQDYVTLYPHKPKGRAAKADSDSAQREKEATEETGGSPKVANPSTKEKIHEAPDKGNDGTDAAGDASRRKPPVWKQVEGRMADGTLEQLRNGSRPARLAGAGDVGRIEARHNRLSSDHNTRRDISYSTIQKPLNHSKVVDGNDQYPNEVLSGKRGITTKADQHASGGQLPKRARSPISEARERGEGGRQARKRRRMETQAVDVRQDESEDTMKRELQRGDDDDDADGGFFEE